MVIDTSALIAIFFEELRKYGKGRGSGAKLNYGDCISYGTAKCRNEALLYVGDDFAKTDIKPA